VTITLSRPIKWDIDNPALYQLKTIVSEKNKISDEYFTTLEYGLSVLLLTMGFI
jgi:beta-galactosidase/beta-glucuronidase